MVIDFYPIHHLVDPWGLNSELLFFPQPSLFFVESFFSFYSGLSASGVSLFVSLKKKTSFDSARN